MKIEELYTLEQLPKVSQELTDLIKLPATSQLSSNTTLITLTGDLGAGKTTLVKHLLRSWGVQDEILSPTFTYVNCYKNDQGQKIYHFDLYRVSNLNQFSELGFDEYLHEPGGICLIEWPQVIAPILGDRLVYAVEIEHVSDFQRRLKVKLAI